jgi:hypothetical protein
VNTLRLLKSKMIEADTVETYSDLISPLVFWRLLMLSVWTDAHLTRLRCAEFRSVYFAHYSAG